ncbi:MAG: S8 family serine peptidase, partial [Chitinophagaceae bacterium]
YKKSPTPVSGNSVNFTPNDTRYNEQWNYNNTGQAGGTAGKDIKLPQAWDIETGKPGTIVAVIDGGAQFDHPDIAANMWPTNGFNFVTNSTVIDPDDHGTHTSGTVAAVSNNNIGVSGVAGGNGTPGSGVKLMTLGVFGSAGGAASNFGAPFIWAADRGAMVAQNSWGYTSPNVYDQTVLDGIDYFVANGGGAVLKGGIVIFAAGNANSELNFYPGYYDKVLAVAATNNKDVRASYSNFGAYVDISAPGGEQSFANDPGGVLSTIAGGLYENFQGTSMACPHVSGVAALIVAKAGIKLSNDDVKAILLTTTDNHYPDNNSFYAGKLGTGRLNAFKAIQKAEEIANAPSVDAVTGYSATISCPNTSLVWTKNGAGNDVMIAYSTDGIFGLPAGAYNLGDIIPNGGGTVIYKGNGTTFSHPVPKDSATLTYKIWSVNATNNYSAGLIKTVKTPFSLRTFIGNSAGATIVLTWTKSCPNSDVIVATNNASTFGIPIGTLNVGDNIPGGGKVIYKGSALSFTHTSPISGANFYRIWPAIGTNYSQFFLNVAVCFGSIPGPVTEGFQGTVFPPVGWQILNPNSGSITWERSTAAGSGSSASAIMRFYDYGTRNHLDYLLSPSIIATNADSIIFSFDRAYRFYSATFADTLEIVVSTDCGNSFQSVWKRGGAQLATAPGTSTVSYIPAAADWLNLRLDVKSIVGNASSFLVGFKTINRFGQNLYLDNVNIFTVENGRRDATVKQVVEPSGKLCARTFLPRVQIGNQGKDTLKTVKVMYRFNAATPGALDSVVWTGSLPLGGTAFVDLKNTTLTTGGAYQFIAYTKEPNGLADQIPINDTAKVSLTVFDPQPDPAKEGFEQTTFPPANWFVASSGSAYTWERNTRGATEKSASVWIRNYRFSSAGKKDDLFSPLVQVASPDSVYLKFDLANASRRFPGSTNIPLDTLEVLLTTDCGKTLRSVYKKWGEDLTSVDPNFPPSYASTDTIGFVPTSANQWKAEWLDLTRFVPANSKFQVVFRSTSNRGNNTFLDKIEISTLVLPARLKQAGYMIAPNPFEGSFTVRHLLPPTNLKGLRVSNSTGQVVVARTFNGNASNYIVVDLSRYANGLYNVELLYDNDVKKQTVIKRR